MATYSSAPRVVTKNVAFDDAAIAAADGIKVSDLAADDLVTKVWVEVPVAFNSGTSDTATVGVADDDGSNPTALATFNAQTASAVVGGEVEVSTPPATLGTGVGRSVGAGKLFVKVVGAGAPASAGSLIVHALIEPADLVQSAYSAAANPTPTQSVKQGTPTYKA